MDEVLGRLDAVIADVDGLPLSCLDVEQLNQVLVRTVGLVSQAQGLQFAVMQEAEAAGLPAQFGSRILTTHLAKTTGGNAKVLGADRSLSVWLRDFPVFQQAMIDGTFTRAHVNELKRIDSPRVHGLLVRDQQMLVDAAQEFVWPEWAGVVGYWLNAADPDGELNDPSDPAYG